jgi:putative transposase
MREDFSVSTQVLQEFFVNSTRKIKVSLSDQQALNIEAAPLHPERRHAASPGAHAIGIDRGLTTFAVLADESGHELERIESPRPLLRALPRLRKQSRALSRKKLGSRNRERQRGRISKLHERIGNVRRDFVHRQSTRLAKTHGLLVIEDLCTAGLIRSRLARSIADSAWGLFAILLGYKTVWYGGVLVLADRFYPSTRRCSACGQVGEKLALSERTFRCKSCGHEADRDTNAAVCLAQWPRVAAQHAETSNARGERSAGERVLLVRETSLVEAGRAYARRPRRAVRTETVHTL